MTCDVRNTSFFDCFITTDDDGCEYGVGPFVKGDELPVHLVGCVDCWCCSMIDSLLIVWLAKCIFAGFSLEYQRFSMTCRVVFYE